MDEMILSTIKNNDLCQQVILCVLLVDDRKNGNGAKWFELQREKFNSGTQPFHILYSWKDGEILKPIGYTPDSKMFSKWLNNGIDYFYNK